jgi:ppGpp synthetase/RelA/SpoT-type nucleotidyltranferase
MKIPRSVRDLYSELLPIYERLKTVVDELIASRKENRWHYEGRLKGEESFALKLETGRVGSPLMLEDFFGCTLVVENHARIADAEKLVGELFDLHERRPSQAISTRLAPCNFDFDDLRLYVRWKDDPAQRPTGLHGRLFEVQIKTFLQQAWGIATHDFVYKTDAVDWAMSRIAFQVKAMLEHAELSIGEARRLTNATLLNRSDRDSEQLQKTIEDIKSRWKPEQLPKDLSSTLAHFPDPELPCFPGFPRW